MLALNQFSGLLLWINLLTFVQCDTSCTLEGFKQSGLFDENFSLSNLKPSYDSGENVRVHCKVGFRGFFKLICSEGQWFNTGNKCQPISCGHPGDVQFADFQLVRGSDYVFGSQVQYTCHRGYQMSSFTSTRDCLQGGWSGHLPECEPVSCPSLTLEDNVLVSGDLDHPTSGSVLQFSCRSRDHELEGPTQIECNDAGNWSSRPPICKEISCPKPPLDNFQVEGQKIVYRKDEVLRYKCNPGYKKVDGRPSLCKKVGQSAQWSPSPRCEVITCKVSARPPAGTRYDPVNQIIFGVGQSVTVSCGRTQWVKSRELQSAQLICQGTGNWDFEPVCQLVTCTKSAENVYNWQDMWYTSKMDETVWYQCHRGYEETARRARCTREGWEPNPLCREKRCPKPLYRNAEITDNYKKDTYEHEAIVNFRCLYDQPEVTFQVDCSFGQWRGYVRTCKEKTCTSQPHVENGDMLDERKREYQHRERVRFQCQGETGIFGVSCLSGEWMAEKTCADVACMKQPNIKNGEMVSREEPPFKHGATVEIRCTTGSVDNFRVSCQSGKWTDHQCPEISACGSTAIPNGFSHELQNKLYYTCNQGYKLLGKGWWGVASCEGGPWKTSECVAATDCGSIPDIPNMIVRSESPRFSDRETFPIQCETGYQNTHPDLQVLTCSKGSWNSNNVKFKDICTPIEAKCIHPSRVRNAVIMASFEKEYLSGTSLTFKCRDNFIEEGDATIQCINGTWGQTSFNCKEPPNPQ